MVEKYDNYIINKENGTIYSKEYSKEMDDLLKIIKNAEKLNVLREFIKEDENIEIQKLDIDLLKISKNVSSKKSNDTFLNWFVSKCQLKTKLYILNENDVEKYLRAPNELELILSDEELEQYLPGEEFETYLPEEEKLKIKDFYFNKFDKVSNTFITTKRQMVRIPAKITNSDEQFPEKESNVYYFISRSNEKPYLGLHPRSQLKNKKDKELYLDIPYIINIYASKNLEVDQDTFDITLLNINTIKITDTKKLYRPSTILDLYKKSYIPKQLSEIIGNDFIKFGVTELNNSTPFKSLIDCVFFDHEEIDYDNLKNIIYSDIEKYYNLCKQELINISSIKEFKKLINKENFFIYSNIYKLLEHIVQANIFCFKYENEETEMVTPNYKIMYCRSLKYNNNIILFEQTKLDKIKNYELICKINEDNDMQYIFTNIEIKNIIEYSKLKYNIYFKNQYDINIDIRTLIEIPEFYKIIGQFIDNYGKLRIVEVENNETKETFQIYTPPLAPIFEKLIKFNTKIIDEKIILNYIKKKIIKIMKLYKILKVLNLKVFGLV